jgi:hypothetical protein
MREERGTERKPLRVEAEKWRHLTVSTVFEDTLDSQSYTPKSESIPEC